ncbi:MAG: GGDEF domain-containing protein [Myxococcales bacterium]|nr:GGDEF domain-containing protein [Myxococcales bacterium]
MMQSADFWLTMTRAMLSTLEFEQILYILLSGSTAGDGLNFNRAWLFLKDEEEPILRGKIAIGPASKEEAHRIWEALEAERFDLSALVKRYEAFEKDPDASALSARMKEIEISLPPQRRSVFGRLLADVLEQAQPVFLNDEIVQLPQLRIPLKQVAFVPLCAEEQILGVLVVDNSYNLRPIEASELDILHTVANLAAIAVERARLHSRVRYLAECDALTGLLNRHVFEEKAREAFQQADAKKEALSLLMIDVDHFKQYNDRYGHLVGDALLRSLGKLLRGFFGEDALVGRFGGDEIVALLPKRNNTQALKEAERLRQTFAETGFGPEDSIYATVTIGLASKLPRHDSFESMFLDADAAMYAAKRQGRDRVMLLSLL